MSLGQGQAIEAEKARLIRASYPAFPVAAAYLLGEAANGDTPEVRQAAGDVLVKFERDKLEREALRRERAHNRNASTGFLRALSAAEVYENASIDEVEWILEPFIPKGRVTALCSFMKEGKSTLAFAIVGAALSGRPFLGRSTSKVRVFWLSPGEEHLADIKTHMQESGIGPDAALFVHAAPFPSTPEAIAELRGFVAENRIELVVIDTLSRFWRVKSENDAAEVITALSPILDLSRDLGVAVLLLHHVSKGAAGERDSYRQGREIRGSGAILGVVDQALILRRAKGGSPSVRVLHAVGRYRETPAETLIGYDEVEGYRLIPGATPSEANDARAQRLVGYVYEHPGCTKGDAVHGAKVGRTRGFEVVNSLVGDGRLDVRNGRLHLPTSKTVPTLAVRRGTVGTSTTVPTVPPPPKNPPSTGTAGVLVRAGTTDVSTAPPDGACTDSEEELLA